MCVSVCVCVCELVSFVKIGNQNSSFAIYCLHTKNEIVDECQG